jgi:hypothetical protein
MDTDGNFRMWRSDGSREGTAFVTDKDTGLPIDAPALFKIVGNRLLFSSGRLFVENQVWWITDINNSEASQIIVEADQGFDTLLHPTFIDGKIIFAGTQSDTGFELWSMNTCESDSLQDLCPPPEEGGGNADFMFLLGSVLVIRHRRWSIRW